MEKEDRREVAKAVLRMAEIFFAALVAAPTAARFLQKEPLGTAALLGIIVGLAGVLTLVLLAVTIMKGKWK